MTSVEAFDAKMHLGTLLKRVSKGETIQLTQRGLPIAKIVPADDGERGNPVDLVREIRAVRKGATLGKSR